MTKGKYVRTPEIREKMRCASIGKHPSDETRKKLGLSHKGFRHSEASKTKISNSKKGHAVTSEAKEKMRIGHIGKSYLKGRTLSEETKKKISIAHKGLALGRKHSEETKRKISLGNKGKNLGKHTSEELKQKLRYAGIEFWTNLGNAEKKAFMTRSRISKPQQELYSLLKQVFSDATLEYPIITRKSIRFADIGVPSLKIDFEYDDPYWHNRKKTRDDIRDKDVAEVGWATFRVNKEALKVLAQQPRFIMLEAYNKQ